ncbi:hypothetical protein HNQ59_002853 [Chitinivorax tropicus]|uniref:Class I SAM-dependent methyltransferase n=1 Tax=Chitinivorax tropicus TaxID=714531 RepID=A0A840MWK1_9PROT|nr:class I SAM-dependent methyltransferase [Chitinivorax tropicus]MBB5019551.1 hypothetical protein [Chitinivorax tropicus]
MSLSLSRMHWWGRVPVSIQALVLQVLVFPLTWISIWLMAWLGGAPSWLSMALFQGGWSALASHRVGLPSWWWGIQAAFWPLLWLMLSWQWPAWLPALIFAVLVLVYGGGVGSRVPLFLSSQTTCQQLLTVLPTQPALQFLDVGAGLGGVLNQVQQARPDWRCAGVERAWLPWLIGRCRLRWLASPAQWLQQDFNQLDWSRYDIVYAYLSPAPMAQVWQKVEAEMRPGSMFISNSFDVPDVTPDQVIETGDWHRSRLLIWYR